MYSFEQQVLDEKQNDAITAALKELSLRKDYLEENLKLAHELKVMYFPKCSLTILFEDLPPSLLVFLCKCFSKCIVLQAFLIYPLLSIQAAEDERYIFTSAMLGLLAEYDIRPHVLNASVIAISAKVFFFSFNW